MRKNPNPPVLLPLLLAAVCAVPMVSRATPYATSLTNNAGVVSFRLNQSADKVLIVYTNLGGSLLTNDLGTKPAGLSVESLGVPGNFSVVVEKTNTAGYLGGATLQMTADTNRQVIFFSPRGVAVNQNPASPNFGRIYVANALVGTASGTTRSTGDGFYALNADYTDALGQGDTARTGGVSFTPSTGNGDTPYRVEIGEDGNLYTTSYATTNGGIFVSDPDITTTTKVLNTTNRFPGSALVTGSLGGGNLVIHSLDTDDASGFNRIRRFDIGAGPLPSSAVGNISNDVATGYLQIRGVVADLAKGPDGKFYFLQNRSAGGEAGIFVVNPADDSGTAGFSPANNGLWDIVYSSYADSLFNFPGQTNDILATSRAVAISPDGRFMAVNRDNSSTWIIPLNNGIPVLAERKLINTNSVGTSRDVCFDVAGNVYVVSGGTERLRVFSPGYFSRAVTSSEGTFSVTNIIPPTVTVAKVFDGAEPATDGRFSLSRTGDASSPLTVQVSVGGTATPGLDYLTNSFSFVSNNILAITFGVGVSSVDVDIPVLNDSLMEPTETVIFGLIPSLSYVAGGTGSATLDITDDGDTIPVVSLAARGSGFSELLSGRPAKFLLTTLLPVPSDLTVNIALSGSAVSGVDYANPATFSVTITNGTSTNFFTVTPINNDAITSNRTVTASVVSDPAYGTGVSNASLTLREDDLPARPVLFADNFETNSSANWVVKGNNADVDAVFAYDYSAVGIPPAPNSTNGTTLGMRMRANIAGGAITGLGASPVGLALPSDYRLRFDLWMNFVGPMPGGTGATEYFNVGVGVDANRTNSIITTPTSLPGSTVIFSVSGDGGGGIAAGNFSIHTNGVRIESTSTNLYPAGSRDDSAPYYAELGELSPPVAQAGLFPTQTGVSDIGTMGFAWHDVMVLKQGTNYQYYVDGLLIARIGYPSATVGSNFMVGHMDTFASLSADPLMTFSLVDNLRVESLTFAPPVITSVTLINGGTDVRIDFNGGNPLQAAGSYSVVATGDLTASFGGVSASITPLGGGQFRAETPAVGGIQFYRILRVDP